MWIKSNIKHLLCNVRITQVFSFLSKRLALVVKKIYICLIFFNLIFWFECKIISFRDLLFTRRQIWPLNHNSLLWVSTIKVYPCKLQRHLLVSSCEDAVMCGINKIHLLLWTNWMDPCGLATSSAFSTISCYLSASIRWFTSVCCPPSYYKTETHSECHIYYNSAIVIGSALTRVMLPQVKSQHWTHPPRPPWKRKSSEKKKIKSWRHVICIAGVNTKGPKSQSGDETSATSYSALTDDISVRLHLEYAGAKLAFRFICQAGHSSTKHTLTHIKHINGSSINDLLLLQKVN